MPRTATKKKAAVSRKPAKKTVKKTVAKKAPAKKAVAKKTVAKKAPAKKVVAKKVAVKKVAKPKAISKVNAKLTKTQLNTMIAEQTGLNRKEVNSVFDTLEVIINASVKKGAFGEFTLPGLAKIVTIRKKAVKARKGINPFTGEEIMFKAKPARTVVKVRPLKKLKDMVV